MAKKSSKSSRRVRTAKKVQGGTPSKETKQQKPGVEPEAAAAQEPAETKPAAIKASTRSSKKPAAKAEMSTIDAPAPEMPQTVAPEMVQPQRARMLVYAAALGIVIVVLVFVAALMRQQASQQPGEVVKSDGDSSKADEVLHTGGSVCTNGPTQTDAQSSGSTNPGSVGMMLQNNPSNNIQTPQTLSAGNDASTLQGAACF